MIQYFFENLWLAWLLVGLLCLVLELTNGDFFIICFAIGGVVAAIVSTFSDSYALQVIAFAVVSALSIFFVRPFALRLTDSKLYSLQRDRLKHEYILLKPKLWQFRKLRTLSDKAQIQQITSLHRSIYR